MIPLVVVAATAGEPVEEVIVWADPFARWRQRWTVATEVHFAEPPELIGWHNTSLELLRMQLRMVIACDDTGALLPNLHEVVCEIEDLSIVAMPRVPRASDLEVVRQIDATLTGAQVQLQVSADGKVPNVDLEGIAEPDQRARERAELRLVVSRAMSAFHLDLETPVRDGMVWQEYGSRLFEMPSLLATRGGSVVTHYLDAVGPGMFVVQSIGEADVMPGTPVEFSTVSSSNSVSDMPRWYSTPSRHYRSVLTGVASIDRATGVMTERVWAVTAPPTGPARNLQYSTGRLRMLGADERVDVGPTVVTTSADGRFPSRPAWVPLEP
ncbi:MAG: hypothetical protein ABMA64_20045 [Myxococcota bacterium]